MYRASVLPSSKESGNGATQLLALQEEVKGFLQLKAQSRAFGDALEALGEQTEQLVTGGRAVADVVESWQNVFRSTHLAMASLAEKRVPPSAEHPVSRDLPDTLVRVPLKAAAE